jgi:hypothetical protein
MEKAKLRIYSILFAVSAIPFLLLSFASYTEASTGWLSGWTYRKQITVTHGSSETGTNFQVKLKVGESSGSSGADFNLGGNSSSFPSAKNAGGDIRFTSSDGSTTLSFWVESISGTAPNRTAMIWVKVAADLSTANQNIYVYYGNSSASNSSSGTNTFILFDDFDGANYNTNNSWKLSAASGSSVSVASSQVTFTSASINGYVWLSSPSTFVYPTWMETKVDSFNSNSATYRMGATTGTTPRSDNGNLYNEYSADALSGTYRIVSDNSIGGYSNASSGAMSDTSGIWSFAWVSNSSKKFYLNYSPSLSAGADGENISITNYYMYLGNASSAAGSSVVDWARVRKYAATEPSFNSATTQEAGIDASLSGFTISSGTLSPTFASSTTAYTDSVGNSVNNITVTPTATQGSSSTITVNSVAVVSGATSSPISLNVGSNTVTVTVTAPDGSTQKTYTVVVTRANSADATLSSLGISSGILSPTFASGTTTYTVNVANATTSITFTPTANDTNYHSIMINGNAITSGATSSPITLSSGSNTVTIVVTAQDNSTTQTYTVTVTRTSLPIISAVTTYTSSSGAIIEWTTDKSASSLVNYGLTASTTSATSEIDVSSRTTSHSVHISGLVACARYYFNVQSTDANTNTGYGSVGTFKTSGCTGDATITDTGQGIATQSSGGSVSEGTITVTAPANFVISSSTLVLQANKLDSTSFSSNAGTPSGRTQVGTDVYTLKALTDATSSVSSFNAPVTVTMNYNSGDLSGLSESSLWIYRYDGSQWYALDSCNVNTSAKTVTCTTQHFSDFAIFGQQQSTVTSGSSGGSGGGGGGGGGGIIVGCADPKATNYSPLVFGSDKTLCKYATTTTQVIAISTTTQYTFARNLKLGSRGEDVRQLQIFLNTHGFMLANSGAGSVGEETINFGTLTRNALIKFQEANTESILKQYGLKYGTGLFYTTSRALVNSMMMYQ